jgi:hypothetical protein
MRVLVLLSLIFLFLVGGTVPVHAEGDQQRGKKLDFDGDVVEGVNKQPLDTLNQISEQDRKNRRHLYRKRADFDAESSDLVREVMEIY